MKLFNAFSVFLGFPARNKLIQTEIDVLFQVQMPKEIRLCGQRLALRQARKPHSRKVWKMVISFRRLPI
jgi:hypothetical protein